jgi:Tol biopolymer transport system component
MTKHNLFASLTLFMMACAPSVSPRDKPIVDPLAPNQPAVFDEESADIVYFDWSSLPGPKLTEASTRSGQSHPLVSLIYSDNQLAVAPDGRTIAFSYYTYVGKPGRFTLDTITPGMDAPRLVLDVPNGVVQPAWSPDGKQLAFVSFANDMPYRWNIERIGSDGAGAEVLASVEAGPAVAPAECIAPRWSPDGREILFAGRRAGSNGTLWAVDVATHAVRVVFAPEGAQSESCRGEWSHDGRRVAVTWWSDTDPTHHLQVVTATGGSGETVALQSPPNPDDHVENGAAKQWSPDDSQIAFVAFDPTPSDAVLRTVRVADRQLTTLDHRQGDGAFGNPQWSCDGQTLAYERHYLQMGGSKISIVDAAGGVPRTLPGDYGHGQQWLCRSRSNDSDLRGGNIKITPQ